MSSSLRDPKRGTQSFAVFLLTVGLLVFLGPHILLACVATPALVQAPMLFVSSPATEQSDCRLEANTGLTVEPLGWGNDENPVALFGGSNTETLASSSRLADQRIAEIPGRPLYLKKHSLLL